MLGEIVTRLGPKISPTSRQSMQEHFETRCDEILRFAQEDRRGTNSVRLNLPSRGPPNMTFGGCHDLAVNASRQ
jgi:hypothetical protein